MENLENEVIAEEKNLKSVTNIVEHLNTIDANYQSQYPVFDEASLPQFKSFERPNEVQIKQNMEQKIEEQKNIASKQVVNKANEQLNQLDDKLQSIKSDYENAESKLNNAMQFDLEKSKANTIKQGIERSSIAQNINNQIKSQYEVELQKNIQNASNKIDEINLKRTLIKSEMDLALESFDIKYASQLEEKIMELNKDYDQQMLEISQYNSEISKIRAKQTEEWQQWANSVTSELDAKKGYDKTVYVIGQLQGLTKAEATRILSDAEVKQSLGGWYSAVADYVERNFR